MWCRAKHEPKTVLHHVARTLPYIDQVSAGCMVLPLTDEGKGVYTLCRVCPLEIGI